MTNKTTLVLGASPKNERYSNMAVRRLRAHGHSVVAVGLREGMIGDHPIVTAIPEGTTIHTVTLYLNERNQQRWEPLVLALAPERIIFNPGAENAGFSRKAASQGIEVMEACTLVMLGAGQY